ncbi:PAS domain S-box-containing protein/diguanylate cyclase (GGDEF)-like protein [Rhizobium subbaraonis]|uniref:PAS domain S-box-containing protein/diguanylate cyclase (GGDEF)-like protein n=1 Tax=Rhizobium subbaraonis TaxID=908946 RepID=A0A285U166_9HYPH|nr:PAS domain S-box-containing protein/diguanylate cyclase (GGDEF)-like protein [Rhizobium subbaraonis]
MRVASLARGIRIAGAWAKPSLLPAAIAVTVVLVAGHAYERQNERLYRSDLRARVASELTLVSARLEGEIGKSVTALRGIANLFSSEPVQASDQFNVFARKLLVQNVQFRRLAIAPDGVVDQIFPLRDNERYLGADLNRFQSFRRPAEASRAFGHPLMLGPMHLPDRSRAFNLVIPISGTARGAFAFWGYIEGVLDERRLYLDAGLISSRDGDASIHWRGSSNLRLSIRDISFPAAIEDPFFGDPAIFDGEAVRRTVEFPGGKWELAAVPAKGWERPHEDVAYIRIMTAGAALAIIIPIFLTGGLVSERHRHLAGLRARETEIHSLSQRLNLALQASKTGTWEVAVGDRQRIWDRQMYALHGLPADTPLSNDTWTSVVHPDDRAASSAAFERAMEGETGYWLQYRVVLPDGSIRHIRNVGSRMTMDGVEKLTGVSWDVTEDVQLNARLQAAKERADRQNDTLLKTTQRLELALDAYQCGLWEADLESGLTRWDDRMFQLYGVDNTGEPITHDIWLNALHPDDRAHAEATAKNTIESGAPYLRKSRVVHPDGTIRHLQSVGKLHVEADGRRKLVGLAFDITDDVEMNEQLRSAKTQADQQNAELEMALRVLSEREQELEATTRRLDLALDSYQCGLWEADLDRGGAYWDERMHQLYGLVYVDGMVTERDWLGAIHPDDRQPTIDNVNNCIAREWPYVQQARIVLAEGPIRHVRSVGKIHRAPDGTRKLVGIAFDVTDDVRMTERLRAAKEIADAKNAELEQAKIRIEHNALHDPLTGLGNRRLLDDQLNALATRSSEEEVSLGILHIDLDRFKQINDTLGHAAGDALLVHAAKVLRNSVRPGDLVARIGGDEFVVVTDSNNSADLAALSNRIIELMRQPVDYNGHMCRFGVSIGIAVGGGRDLDTRKLLVNADIALYRAKAQGRNRHEFFNAVLEAVIIRNKRTADDILTGIENNEFVPYYQPQICARTLELVGAEALIRWRHPQKGLLVPGHFLEIAEDLNVTATLDRIMLEKALTDCSVWAARGFTMPKISVNVSAKRLRDETLVDSLAGLSIAPGQLSFELVEAIFLDDADDLVQTNIERIKDLGIDIEIDDFGTGHTSIVSLLKLRPKRLKIDRQLVAPILNSRHEQALVRSIIEIGRSLGISVVAEGVETMAHAEMLSALGCDLLQGYAFSRPLARDAFLDYAIEKRWRSAS